MSVDDVRRFIRGLPQQGGNLFIADLIALEARLTKLEALAHEVVEEGYDDGYGDEPAVIGELRDFLEEKIIVPIAKSDVN